MGGGRTLWRIWKLKLLEILTMVDAKNVEIEQKT
jgi:hypothetical protein